MRAVCCVVPFHSQITVLLFPRPLVSKQKQKPLFVARDEEEELERSAKFPWRQLRPLVSTGPRHPGWPPPAGGSPRGAQTPRRECLRHQQHRHTPQHGLHDARREARVQGDPHSKVSRPPLSVPPSSPSITLLHLLLCFLFFFLTFFLGGGGSF